MLTTTVGDSARHLDIAAGPDDDDRLSLPGDGRRYEELIETLQPGALPALVGHRGDDMDLDIDAERLVDARAAITYLCTPNNPTATAATRAAVEHVVEHATGVVIIDEAYGEFAPERFADLVSAHERVLITRTFSKAFGLAGLRVGFGFGSRDLTRLVARARGPYKVNAMAERAVRAALGAEEGGRLRVEIIHRAMRAYAMGQMCAIRCATADPGRRALHLLTP